MTTTRSGVRIDTDSATTNTHVPGPWALKEAVLRDELGGDPRFVRFTAADGETALRVISRQDAADPHAALPVNELATTLIHRATGQAPPRPLRGPVVVLGAGRVAGLWRTGDLTDFHRALLHSLAREQGSPEVPGSSASVRLYRD
ncbi:hypothetical protein ACIREO_22365 [Streptomyces sp. NPDC102441]|uniref:hypothetical protein n=1 Tax=Streptomyces sp. NPDC102441 TaxID=3366176 RepID=UPI00380F5556